MCDVNVLFSVIICKRNKLVFTSQPQCCKSISLIIYSMSVSLGTAWSNGSNYQVPIPVHTQTTVVRIALTRQNIRYLQMCHGWCCLTNCVTTLPANPVFHKIKHNSLQCRLKTVALHSSIAVPHLQVRDLIFVLLWEQVHCGEADRSWCQEEYTPFLSQCQLLSPLQLQTWEMLQ